MEILDFCLSMMLVLSQCKVFLGFPIMSLRRLRQL